MSLLEIHHADEFVANRIRNWIVGDAVLCRHSSGNHADLGLQPALNVARHLSSGA